MTAPDEKTLREALHRIHHVATCTRSDCGERHSYMEIPANPKRDADLLLSAAIDELVQLRASAALADAIVKDAEDVSALSKRCMDLTEELSEARSEAVSMRHEAAANLKVAEFARGTAERIALQRDALQARVKVLEGLHLAPKGSA